MKIFRIIADRHGYDQFDSAIVVCESKEKLQKLIDDGVFYGKGSWYWHYGMANGLSLFEKEQSLSIEEIELDKIEDTEILLGSYNEG